MTFQNCVLHIDGPVDLEDEVMIWNLLNSDPRFEDGHFNDDNQIFQMASKDRKKVFVKASKEFSDYTFAILCDDNSEDSCDEFHNYYSKSLFAHGEESLESAHKWIEYYKNGKFYKEPVQYVSRKFDGRRLK